MGRPPKADAGEIARRLAEHNERVAQRQGSRGRFNPKYTHQSMRRFEQEGTEDDAPVERAPAGGGSVIKLRDLVQRVLMELEDYAPQKAQEFRRELKGMS